MVKSNAKGKEENAEQKGATGFYDQVDAPESVNRHMRSRVKHVKDGQGSNKGTPKSDITVYVDRRGIVRHRHGA